MNVFCRRNQGILDLEDRKRWVLLLGAERGADAADGIWGWRVRVPERFWRASSMVGAGWGVLDVLRSAGEGRMDWDRDRGPSWQGDQGGSILEPTWASAAL